MLKFLFILLAVVAAVAGLLLGTLNSEAVVLDLLWVQLHWPLGLVVVVMLAAGLLLGVVMTWLAAVLPLRLARRHKPAAPASTAVPDPLDHA
jgi:uncharacterized membrane protein YciS (DUF1049 family)